MNRWVAELATMTLFLSSSELQTFRFSTVTYLTIRTGDLWEDAHDGTDQVEETHLGSRKRE